MKHTPFYEELIGRGLPSIAQVSKISRERRTVDTHFYHDDEELYACGFDSATEQVFGFRVFRSKPIALGYWGRVSLNWLENSHSELGIKFLINQDFQSGQLATNVRRIRECLNYDAD